ncbi:MAG TPA: protein-methionine-sulfoxide reductase catalytic subunit MsrP [Aquabacterium sp.]|nr:protein-methionine-sulfoxide reductase catalytic subunit MsrP [Aquabacterium sp.]
MSWIRTSRHFLHPDSGMIHPHASEITPQSVYDDRRRLLKEAGWLGAGLGLGVTGLPAWAAAPAGSVPPVERPGKLAALKTVRSAVPGAVVSDKLTPYDDVTTYNNFYEFGTDKDEPAERAHTLRPRPWSVMVDGEVGKPQRFDIDSLMKLGALEERIYRLRCVEGWSMVIPWVGFSLSTLLKKVEPNSRAKYVEFTTLADPQQMPKVTTRILDWPYVEGLRMDEAMHPLTLLTFGLYGEVLPNQNGAPVRVVVPWKYGFKSAKSLVHIRLVEQQPVSSWTKANAREYGFYSNVNPHVDHPRWSQATERRLGDGGLFAPRRATLMFNGYEAQVGQMYAGMDLKKYY